MIKRPFENPVDVAFGWDASGGPFKSDPRKQRVAFAAAVPGTWEIVSKLGANQTVPLEEANALLYCLRATQNDITYVTDAQYAYNRAKRTQLWLVRSGSAGCVDAQAL